MWNDMEKFRRLEWIDYYVTERKPGVFVLSNDGEVVLEIGRSDEDLYETLKMLTDGPRGVEGKYAYFWFDYADSAYQAYTLHCKLWHRHRHNYETHPKPPDGKDWSCPIDGCLINPQECRTTQ